MQRNQLKKTDRRTIYTVNVIKEALLALEAETTYDHINVTMICRQADISRATFYLHFDSLDQVLDAVIDDALLFSNEASGNAVDVLDIIKSGNLNALKNEAVLPACQRIADSEQYHHLFMDPVLSDHIINRLWVHEHDAVVYPLMEKGRLSEEDANMIFFFILHGSFAVNRSLKWEKNEKWYRYQSLLSQFINSGTAALRKNGSGNV